MVLEKQQVATYGSMNKNKTHNYYMRWSTPYGDIGYIKIVFPETIAVIIHL